MNDIRTFEMSPVNVWLEHQRIHVFLLNAPLKFTIEGDVKLLTTMRTPAIDFDQKSLIT